MTDALCASIALEGPCCAGKTTLGLGLLGDFAAAAVSYVRDYSDFVGGGRFLPSPVPTTLAEEEQTLNVFLRIEAARTKESRCSSADVILIDRSVHTLLAHCLALETMTGVGYARLAEVILLQSSVPLWPNEVLYLDVPIDVIMRRNKGKFSADSIFVNSDFNLGIKLYFRKLAGNGTINVAWQTPQLTG